jgi:hypothetical protein
VFCLLGLFYACAFLHMYFPVLFLHFAFFQASLFHQPKGVPSMAKRISSAATQATRYAGHAASKAITGLGRWAVTDHTGATKLLATLPPMGFIDTLSMIVVTALFSLLGAFAAGLMVFLLVAFGLPMLFTL